MADNMNKTNNTGNDAIEIKATLFKPSGKYYAEDKITIPDKAMQMFQIVDWLRDNYKAYKGMALVAMMDELDHGYPIMIPADQRGELK